MSAYPSNSTVNNKVPSENKFKTSKLSTVTTKNKTKNDTTNTNSTKVTLKNDSDIEAMITLQDK